jgi:SAM-dependent methyltransferase
MSVSARDMMNPGYRRVGADQTIIDAAQQMVPAYFALPVVSDGDRLEGIVTAMDIVKQVAAQQNLAATGVGPAASRAVSVGPDESLEAAAENMAQNPGSILPVVEDGKLLGVVTQAEISSFRVLSRLLGERAGELSTEIGEGDSMLEGFRGHYFLAVASALQVIRISLQAAGKTDVESILDFPCGWGRVLRVLKVAFPGARLTASDIDRDGVDFCAGAFGARPVYSALDPDDVDLGEKFDLIWCGSLFTHFPARRWPGFLDLFARSLKPDGVLVFTTLPGDLSKPLLRTLVHPSKVDAIREEFEREGYGYVEQTDEDTGLAITSPEWIRAHIQEHPGLRLVRLDEAAWQPPLPRHDVTTCVAA